MTFTEDEAKTKRCQESFGDGNVTAQGHMVSVQAGYGAAYAMGTSPSMCIASRCMAWEWAKDRTIDRHFTGFCGKARRLF